MVFIKEEDVIASAAASSARRLHYIYCRLELSTAAVKAAMTPGAARLIQSAMCRTNVLHRPAPSKFFFPGLSTQPLFNPDHFAISAVLRDNFNSILGEYKALRASGGPTSDYDTSGGKPSSTSKTAPGGGEHTQLLHSGGQWDWNSYILRGQRQANFAASCPLTADILESSTASSTPGAGRQRYRHRLMTDIPFSFAFFSTLHAHTNIAAHHGPCNLRLRCHFPLIVPSDSDGPASDLSVDFDSMTSSSGGSTRDSDNNNNSARTINSSSSSSSSSSGSGCGMRIADHTVRWQAGEPVFFDDCYEHTVWNNTSSERVVLIFDVWHPELHPEEIKAIVDMFDEAKRQGWLT